jgi:hypothetical protein
MAITVVLERWNGIEVWEFADEEKVIQKLSGWHWPNKKPCHLFPHCGA